MSQKKIQVTKNYRLFKISEENRNLELARHKKLKLAMQEYGFLPSFPIVVFRSSTGELIVLDGQHRLAFAEMLGLPVYWTESAVEFDIAKINGTTKIWLIRDYAEKFAKQGMKPYEQLIEFADRHQMGISLSVCLLAGTVSFGNVSEAYLSGRFKIKDHERAELVATMYTAFILMDKRLANMRLAEALVATSRVTGFESKRLTASLEHCKEKLHPFSTRDGYLDMIQEIYNYRKSKLVPLKINAIQAMRERSAAETKKPTAAAKAS